MILRYVPIALAILLLVFLVWAFYFLWKKQSKQAARESFVVWLIFGIIFALSPIIFNSLLAYLSDKPVLAENLFGNGELLIVSVAIGAEAVGRLIGNGYHQRVYKLSVAGGCLFLVIMAALAFAVISQNPATFHPERTTLISESIFLLTVLTSGCCVILSEV